VSDLTTSGYIKLRAQLCSKSASMPDGCSVIVVLCMIAGNAEMTDLFRCHKSGTQCCAPKSMIREVLDQKNSGTAQATNETFPPHYRPPLSALVPGEGTLK